MTKERVVAGIDYSLSCPAMCVHVGDEWSPNACTYYYLYGVKKWIRDDDQIRSKLHPDSFESDSQRYDLISDFFLNHLASFPGVEVFIENYSFTAHSAATHPLAEACGLLKYKLWKQNIPVTLLPVTGIKKFATGKGNSRKEGMWEAYQNERSYLQGKLDCLPGKSPLADLIDAYFIAKMGFHAKD